MINLTAIQNNMVRLFHKNHLDLIKITGGDRHRFLHNQTTNDFNSLKPCQGCDTVFVTSTARTIDLVTAYIREEEILLLVSPSRKEKLLEWMDKFIFPMDKVEIEDITSNYAVFSLFGENSQKILSEWVKDEILQGLERNNYSIAINDINLILGIGTNLGLQGYNLIIPIDKADSIKEILINKGVISIDEKEYETLRILQGKPKPDAELTEDYNPLEVGLWQTISFDKGCYIGQETITRLNTYKGVKQKLWGINVNKPVTAGEIITVDGEKVGLVTSYTDTDNGGFA